MTIYEHYHMAMVEIANDHIEKIRQGYIFDSETIDIGVADMGGEAVKDARICLPVSMLTRHGLICGATGTGKTITLQLLAEQIAAHGIPVFATDIKGDLSGLSKAGVASDKLAARTQSNGQTWTPEAASVEFFSLSDQSPGIPIRAHLHRFGPLLLARVLGLNTTQESCLVLIFSYAEKLSKPFVTLDDLASCLSYLSSDEGRDDLKSIGGISTSSLGVIIRSLATLQSYGADRFFGEPSFDVNDLFRTDPNGRGIISMLELPSMLDSPTLLSTFVMWTLNELFSTLPEIGDNGVPRLVFFFDEAHLLFDKASPAFLDEVIRTVRLIRSKGVGIFFVTQTASDIPAEVLAQLGSRIQHQMRAHTPADAKALKATVSTFPRCDYDLEEVLTSLGIGEAIVTVLNPDGVPTPVAWTRIFAPCSQMGAVSGEEIEQIVRRSPLASRYESRRGGKPLTYGITESAHSDSDDGHHFHRAQRNEPSHAKVSSSHSARRSSREEKSLISRVIGSSAFKQFARSAGRELVRSLFPRSKRRR